MDRIPFRAASDPRATWVGARLCRMIVAVRGENRQAMPRFISRGPPCASTEELIALARTAPEFGGIYATHTRSEQLPVIADGLATGALPGPGKVLRGLEFRTKR
jgi:hypothetical protein